MVLIKRRGNVWNTKKQFAKALVNSLHAGLSLEEIMALIETPKQDEFGDRDISMFYARKTI